MEGVLKLKSLLWFLLVALLVNPPLVGCVSLVERSHQQQSKPVASVSTPTVSMRKLKDITNHSFRAVWIASVHNMDWPTEASKLILDPKERVSVQKAELGKLLDKVVELGMNAVILQVKPSDDALYRSNLLPWSRYLTGTLGKDPGFDPLAYAIEQAHIRGLQLHAWLNPYRVSTNIMPETTTELLACPTTVYARNPDWVRIAHQRYVLDPGLPSVRHWIEQIVEELITCYPIDGLHFDDYFYYEAEDSRLADDDTYRRYGQGFANKADWRRNNTYLLIQAISRKIKAIRPQITFGISPSGVWRNKSDDPRGSKTAVLNPHYDTAYADTYRWVREGLLDYIAPQVYWSHELLIAPYDVIVNWWSELVKDTPTKLYIGVALYKVGKEFCYQIEGKRVVDRGWIQANGVPEIKRQLAINESFPGVNGSILFSGSYLWEPQTQSVVAYLKSHWGKPELSRAYINQHGTGDD